MATTFTGRIVHGTVGHARDLHLGGHRGRRPDSRTPLDAVAGRGRLRRSRHRTRRLQRQPHDPRWRRRPSRHDGVVADPAGGVGGLSARAGVADDGPAPLCLLVEEAAGAAGVRGLPRRLRLHVCPLVPAPLRRPQPLVPQRPRHEDDGDVPAGRTISRRHQAPHAARLVWHRGHPQPCRRRRRPRTRAPFFGMLRALRSADPRTPR